MPSSQHYLILALLAVIYFTGLVIYRLLFHPLAKFPGSKLAAATKWYEFYYDVFKKPGGTFMREITRMHEEYGPIVRINPHELHIRDSEWFGVLYCGPTSGIRDKYPPLANAVGTPLSIVGTVSHDLHRKRRAAISPFFSKASVTAAVPMILNFVQKAGKTLELKVNTGEVLELRTFYMALATEILCYHSYGKSLGICDNEKAAADWRKIINKTAGLAPLLKQISWVYPIALNLPHRLLQILDPGFARIIAIKLDLRKEAATARQSYSSKNEIDSNQTNASANSKTIYTSIMASKTISSEEKEPERMAQEAFVVQLGGGETTGHALTDITYHLLSNKGTALLILNEELRQVMPNAKHQPDLNSLERLPYLSAVIKEALRVGAFTTSRLPQVSPREPLRYGKWLIPPGTPISMTTRDCLLDPSIFPRPHDFVPERWLVEEPELERMNQAFVPFSRGSRNCVGLNFAMAELYIVTACIFRRFELELYETSRERDIDIVQDFLVGWPSPDTLGVRVKVLGVRT